MINFSSKQTPSEYMGLFKTRSGWKYYSKKSHTGNSMKPWAPNDAERDNSNFTGLQEKQWRGERATNTRNKHEIIHSLSEKSRHSTIKNTKERNSYMKNSDNKTTRILSPNHRKYLLRIESNDILLFMISIKLC